MLYEGRNSKQFSNRIGIYYGAALLWRLLPLPRANGGAAAGYAALQARLTPRAFQLKPLADEIFRLDL
eukprot:6182492-Pleurochrysis_carterae.AAC.3